MRRSAARTGVTIDAVATRMKHTLSALFALSLSALSLDAAPQARPTPLPDRRALLAQAQRARTQSNHSLALYFAEQAGRLQMTSSVRRFIAEEQLALGQLAEAMTSASQCVREANAEPPSENHGLVLTGCQDMVRTLQPRVASATLTAVSELPAALEIEINGRVIPREAGATASYQAWIAPGRAVIRARLPGFSPTEVTRELAAGAQWTAPLAPAIAPARRQCTASSTLLPSASGETVVIPGPAPALDPRARVWFEQLPFASTDPSATPGRITVDATEVSLQRCPPGSTASSIEIAPGEHRLSIALAGHRTLERTITVRPAEDLSLGAIALEPLPLPPVTIPPPRQRVVITRGWSPAGPIVGGIGVVSLGISAGLWLASSSTYDALRARCFGTGCPGDAQSAADAAQIRTFDSATTALLIGGSIAAVAGAVLTFTVRPQRETRVTISATGHGVLVGGRF